MGSLFSAVSAKIFGGLSIALLAFSVWTQLQLMGARKALQHEVQQHALTTKDKQLCEASIAGWKSTAEARQQAADAALEAARKDTVIHTERASTILKEVPATSNECAATLELLRKYQ